MLYVDIPTLLGIRALITMRADVCVSIYVSTMPQSHATASRIAFGNQTKVALEQLKIVGFDKRRWAALAAKLAALGEDDAFWRLQAHTLAILATPDSMRTFRLATAMTEVSDRFHLKPLLRAIAFPQTAFVLAWSAGAVRLVEVFADLPPAVVRVPALPKSAASAVKRASINDLTQNTRISNAEGQKVLLRQYAGLVDAALRAVLSGRETPLILAATEPLGSIFRAVNSYPSLEAEGISTGPDHLSDHELANASRAILDRVYATEVEATNTLFRTRLAQGRATLDIGEAARAATNGAIELLIVDIDHVVPGAVDETSGSVILASTTGAMSYDVIDEIAGRAILSGARFLGVRRADVPGEAPLPAILRYSI
jgi:Bacterial archaeo-eukaryotic release factor family 11